MVYSKSGKAVGRTSDILRCFFEVEQPRGKELEYRIIAVNKADEGEPSNTVMAVL